MFVVFEHFYKNTENILLYPWIKEPEIIYFEFNNFKNPTHNFHRP